MAQETPNVEFNMRASLRLLEHRASDWVGSDLEPACPLPSEPQAKISSRLVNSRTSTRLHKLGELAWWERCRFDAAITLNPLAPRLWRTALRSSTRVTSVQFSITKWLGTP